MADARISAWIISWDQTASLCKLVEDRAREMTVQQTHDILLNNARVMSDLAQADEAVGLAAGAELGRRESEKKRSKDFIEEALRGRP